MGDTVDDGIGVFSLQGSEPIKSRQHTHCFQAGCLTGSDVYPGVTDIYAVCRRHFQLPAAFEQGFGMGFFIGHIIGGDDDLQQIFALAIEHAETPTFSPGQIVLGHYYTNGKHGAEWSVRQIIDEARSEDPNKDMVIFRVVEGHGLRSADSCTRTEFARWAGRELFQSQP